MKGIQSAYNRWSNRYDDQPNPTRDLDAAVLPRIVPDLTGMRVVEAGCGTGKNSGWLADQCQTLLALDFSEGMLAKARQKVTADNVTWARCDLNQPWPVEDVTADVVLFNLVLEHIENLAGVFAEAARILRPGGQMILSEYHPVRLKAENGLGARITDDEGQIVEVVTSYLHSIADFETAAMSNGLEAVARRDWQTAGEERPLILTMGFEKLVM